MSEKSEIHPLGIWSIDPATSHGDSIIENQILKIIQGVIIYCPALKKDSVSDYIFNPIKKVISVRFS